MEFIILAESFWPVTAEGWITLISFIIGFIGAVAALIPTVIKLVKKGKELIANKDWEKIKDIAQAAIEQAEKSGATGADKKQMVLDSVEAACKEAGITLDATLLANLSDFIDTTIKWFNNMNGRETKEEK